MKKRVKKTNKDTTPIPPEEREFIAAKLREFVSQHGFTYGYLSYAMQASGRHRNSVERIAKQIFPDRETKKLLHVFEEPKPFDLEKDQAFWMKALAGRRFEDHPHADRDKGRVYINRPISQSLTGNSAAMCAI